MKTKRISISIILVFVIIVTLFAGIYVSAESAYDELLEQSKLDPNWGNSPVDDFRVYYPLRPGWGCLAVLLYTDVAKDLTFEVQTSDGEEFEVFYPHETMFVFRDSTIISPEVLEATKSCRAGTIGESRSALRECVQHFNISKEELLNAYKLMREDPMSIRSLFPFISDDEFNDSWTIPSYGTTIATEIPDYALEALYMEDDAKAHRLLCREFAVYVEDLGIVVSAEDILQEDKSFSVENLLQLDLTSDEMGEFIDYWSAIFNPNNDAGKKFANLAAAREAQLQAKQAGDATVTSVFVLSLALSTLGAVVLAKKKRKI